MHPYRQNYQNSLLSNVNNQNTNKINNLNSSNKITTDNNQNLINNQIQKLNNNNFCEQNQNFILLNNTNYLNRGNNNLIELYKSDYNNLNFPLTKNLNHLKETNDNLQYQTENIKDLNLNNKTEIFDFENMSKTTNNWKNSFATMRERFGNNDSLKESTQYSNLFSTNGTSSTFPRRKSIKDMQTNSHKSFETNQE